MGAVEPRQVRKEATAVWFPVCRGQPSPFHFLALNQGTGLVSVHLMTETISKTRKGANCTLSFVKPSGGSYSEWILDFETAIAASLKDSLMVGCAKHVRAMSSALAPYSMCAQAAAIISEPPRETI